MKINKAHRHSQDLCRIITFYILENSTLTCNSLELVEAGIGQLILVYRPPSIRRTEESVPTQLPLKRYVDNNNNKLSSKQARSSRTSPLRHLNQGSLRSS